MASARPHVASDYLQDLCFSAVLECDTNIKNGSVQLPQHVCDFVDECVIYIIRDRPMQVDQLIKKELLGDADEMTNIQEAIAKQDDYYCSNISNHRKYIFN